MIEVWEILYYLTEVFELAARLALGPAGSESMTVSARLNGLGRRALVVGQPNRIPFMEPYGPPPDTLAQEVTLPREQLVAEAKTPLATNMARDFFVRFGWKPSHDQLVDLQRELLR